MKDVRPLPAEQAQELDERGQIPQRADRLPDALERDEACVVGRLGRVAKGAGSVRGNRDVESLYKCWEQRRDVRLSSPDLGERDQQQQARPPRAGG